MIDCYHLKGILHVYVHRCDAKWRSSFGKKIMRKFFLECIIALSQIMLNLIHRTNAMSIRTRLDQDLLLKLSDSRLLRSWKLKTCDHTYGAEYGTQMFGSNQWSQFKYNFLRCRVMWNTILLISDYYPCPYFEMGSGLFCRYDIPFSSSTISRMSKEWSMLG